MYISQQILLYETAEGKLKLDVHLENESVWLSLSQMVELFGRDKSVISRHLKNIFQTEELNKDSVVAKIATTAADGKVYQVDYYNLDAILSVGYRVNSKQGTHFRQWASNVLKQHIIQGYTTNERRLAEKGIDELQRAISLLSRTLTHETLVTDIGAEAIQIILGYSKTWRLLLQYDEGELNLPHHLTSASEIFTYEKVKESISRLKIELLEKQEATPLFGQERGDALAAILGNIEQTFGGQDLYPSREEKAAHLLYFVIKDHPFSDGNKRIGSFLFLLYLQVQQIPIHFNDNALVALALLVAESDSSNKDMMIRLVINMLVASND